MPHFYRVFFSLACRVLHRIAFPVVSEWCQQRRHRPPILFACGSLLRRVQHLAYPRSLLPMDALNGRVAHRLCLQRPDESLHHGVVQGDIRPLHQGLEAHLLEPHRERQRRLLLSLKSPFASSHVGSSCRAGRNSLQISRASYRLRERRYSFFLRSLSAARQAAYSRVRGSTRRQFRRPRAGHSSQPALHRG